VTTPYTDSDTTALVPVTRELLLQMRKEGRRAEAGELLRAYTAQAKRQREQDKIETRRAMRRKLSAYGFCKNCLKRDALEGITMCAICRESNKEKNRRTYAAKRSDNRV
jgi:hypothetical protein